MTTPTVDIEKVKDLAHRISIAATWAGSAAHTRRIQEMSDELLTLHGVGREQEEPAPVERPPAPPAPTGLTSSLPGGPPKV